MIKIIHSVLSIKLKTILDQILKEAEEKTYTVDYWYRYGKDGDEKEMEKINENSQ